MKYCLLTLTSSVVNHSLTGHLTPRSLDIRTTFLYNPVVRAALLPESRAMWSSLNMSPFRLSGLGG